MMSANAIWFNMICAVSIALISLSSSRLYRKEPLITSELMSLVSFAPGFFYSAVAIFYLPLHVAGWTLSALLIKNILYCLSFYFRYESLRKFGPFVGALMLGTQPIVIFVFGLFLLGETLSSTQMFSVILAAAALVTLAAKGKGSAQNRINLNDFVKYYAFPALASTLAIVWDRYFLKGHFSSSEFFTLDRLTLVPAFLLTLGLIKQKNFMAGIWRKSYPLIIARNWKSLAMIGALFTFSVYAYNLALGVEKAAVVGLFRNSSYPLAAFAGAFFFQQKISFREWLSLSFVASAIFLGVF